MNIQLLVVGRLKENYFKQAEAEYLKRLRPFCSFTLRECKDENALLASLPKESVLVALDERGKTMPSESFARDILEDHGLHGRGLPLVFAIGGADGHSDEIRRRANRLLSFGQMTIAHRLVRLLLLEQVYRGFKIVRGEPYHRS